MVPVLKHLRPFSGESCYPVKSGGSAVVYLLFLLLLLLWVSVFGHLLVIQDFVPV